MSQSNTYYIDENGQKVFIPDNVEIVFHQHHGTALTVKRLNGHQNSGVQVSSLRNSLSIHPQSSKAVQIY